MLVKASTHPVVGSIPSTPTHGHPLFACYGLVVSPVQAVSIVETSADGGVGHDLVYGLPDLRQTLLGFGDRYADVAGLSVQTRSRQSHGQAGQAPRPVAERLVDGKTYDGQFTSWPQQLAGLAQCFSQRLMMNAGHERNDVEALVGAAKSSKAANSTDASAIVRTRRWARRTVAASASMPTTRRDTAASRCTSRPSPQPTSRTSPWWRAAMSSNRG